MTWNFSRNTLLLVGGLSVHSFAYGFALPNYPLYVKLLGASTSGFGLLVFLKTATLAIFMVPGGWFTDKYGPKKAVLIMGFGDIGSWLILSLAPTWQWLGGYSILTGVAGGFGMGVWYVILSNENSSHNGESNIPAFSVGILSIIIPDTLGSLAGIGYFKIVGDVYTRPILGTTFKFGFLCNFVAIFFYMFIKTPTHPITVEKGTSSISEFFTKKNLPFLGLLCSQFLLGIGGGMILDFFPIYFVDRFQVTPSMNSLLRSLSGLLMAVATFLAPIVARNFGSAKTVFWAECFTIPPLLLLALEKQHFWLAAAAFLIRDTIMHLVPPIIASVMMSKLEEENRGKGGGLFELFWQGGYAISPPISGRWIQTSGFSPSFYVAAMGYGLSAVVFYGAMRSKDSVQSDNTNEIKLQEFKS